jgi:hypothetical protein
MSQCVAIIDVASSTIIAKFTPGTAWPSGTPDPTPGEGQVAVPIPETLSWQCVNSVSLVDDQWIFSENLEFKDQLWRDLRRFRNERLVESDWSQLADAPVDRAVWAAYRQALRDLPSNTVDPARPNWPEKPT